MKKALFTTFVVMLMVSIGYCGGSSVQKWNYNVPDGLFDIDSNNDLSLNTGCNLVVDDGLINVHETFITPAAKSATAYFDNDIATTTLIAGATTYTLANGDYTMSEHCRNVTMDVDFATSEATSTFVGTGLITGINTKGAAATETLTLSTNSVTGAVAWSKITSVVITATTISTTYYQYNI
jgi:hypothetical protein